MTGKSVKIPYLVERASGFYWQPRAEMRAEGFLPKPLGKDPERARQEALRLYEHWCRFIRGEDIAPGAASSRAQATAVKRYPRGSVGEAFQKWIQTSQWAELSPKTRNGEWWPAWTLRIDPVFGRADPRTIGFDDLSAWRQAILEDSGLDTAHRSIKIWRRLWKIMSALRYCDLAKDPSVAIRNHAPPPRHQRFLHNEVLLRVKAAWRRGFKGLACIIAICWDSQLSPGDVRKLRKRHTIYEAERSPRYFDLSIDGRAKTGKPVMGTISRPTDRLIEAYLADRNVDLLDEAFLFCNRSGVPYREDTLADDFRSLMNSEFNGDKRQLRDLRRSGAMEAAAGGVDSKALADKMGNSINTSDKLQKTYQPVDLVNVRRADEARIAGRKALQAENKKRK
jgi:hypothetical protein